MTPSQLAAFKAAILAEPALAAALAAGDHGQMLAFYNAPGTGSIWRPVVKVEELNTAVVWSEYVALSVALKSTYDSMTQSGFVDATSANVRGGFQAVFGPATASRANLLALVARTPTRFESLFTTAQVSAVFGQQVTTADIAAALGS